jgi:hypothetical protein
MARSRSIAIPSDLDNAVSSLFNKPTLSSKTGKLFRGSRHQQLSRESSQSQLGVRIDRSIIEGLQDIVVLLEAQLNPLVQAEFSVIVDVLCRPEFLFPAGTEARRKCDGGGFIRRLIKHTERLLEDKEEKLCIQVLHTMREMMKFDTQYGEKVRYITF